MEFSSRKFLAALGQYIILPFPDQIPRLDHLDPERMARPATEVLHAQGPAAVNRPGQAEHQVVLDPIPQILLRRPEALFDDVVVKHQHFLGQQVVLPGSGHGRRRALDPARFSKCDPCVSFLRWNFMVQMFGLPYSSTPYRRFSSSVSDR